MKESACDNEAVNYYDESSRSSLNSDKSERKLPRMRGIIAQ